jgi:hypothetical protein
MRSKFYRLCFCNEFPQIPHVPRHAACSRIGSISGNGGQRPAAAYSAFPDVLFGFLRTSQGFMMAAATIWFAK